MTLGVKCLASSLLVEGLWSVRIFLGVRVWLRFLDVWGLADLPARVRFVSAPDDLWVWWECSSMFCFLWVYQCVWFRILAVVFRHSGQCSSFRFSDVSRFA